MATKAEIALQSTELAENFRNLYDAAKAVEQARQALKAAKTAEEVAKAKKALEAAKAAKAAAVTAIVDTLINFAVKSDVAAGIGAILSALATVQAASTVATAGLAAGGASLVASILGFILNIIFVFAFAKSPPRVYWDGKVKVKFDPKTFSFGFSIKTTSYKTINGPQIQDEIFKQLKEIVDRVNFAIAQIPKRDRDYIIKYIGLPPSNEVEYILNIDAGTAEKGVQDRFLEAYIREVGGLIKKINELGKEICYLALAKETGLDELIDLRINTWVPDLAYKAEGLYRRELERLSIKLLERREYTRQIRAVWYAVLTMSWHNACVHLINTAGVPPACARNANCSKGIALKTSLDRFKNVPLLKYGADLYGGLDKLKKISLVGLAPLNEPTSRWKGYPVYDPRTYKILAKRKGNQLVLYCSPPEGHIDLTLSFLNHLLSELPKESIDYLAKNVGSIEIYIMADGSVCYCHGHRITYCRGCPPQIGASNFETKFEYWCGFRYRRVHVFDWFEPKYPNENIDAIERILETDLPEQLNALMQDIIDQYAIWQKGYALEWERRVRETLLPNYREAIAPHIIGFMEYYIKAPLERIPEAKREIFIEKEKEAQQIVNYLPMIEKNKDWIIKTFGVDEYNRLVELAKQRYKQMTAKTLPAVEKETLITIKKITPKDIKYILAGLILGYFLLRKAD